MTLFSWGRPVLKDRNFFFFFLFIFFINLFFFLYYHSEEKKKKLGEKWNKELSGSESSNPKCQTWTSDLKLPALFADRLQASMLMKASRKTVLRLTFKQPLYGVKWPNCQRGKPHAAFISHRFDILQRWHISTRTPTKKHSRCMWLEDEVDWDVENEIGYRRHPVNVAVVTRCPS